MYNKFKLPKGVADYLPQDSFAKTTIESALMKSFCDYGYKQIETPILERYALFESGVGKVGVEKLFKVTDVDGDLLVLRPDMTTPTSRIVATKLDGGIHKLCYLGKSFSMLEKSMNREFTQVGIEYMGEQNIHADIEVVALAILSLKNSGLEDFQIDLGNICFFKGFLSQFNLTAEQTDEIIELVEKKDAIGEELWAKRMGLSNDNLALITKLPMLFGGVEVLKEAEGLCVNKEMKKALENLNEIYMGLQNLGLEKYLSFDLSIVGKMKYYSGLVLKGISKHFGRTILSGGRYDNLCDCFGKHISAVGFAIGIGNLLTACQGQGVLPCQQIIDVIIGDKNHNISRMDNMISQLASQGIKAIKSFATTEKQLLQLKKSLNIGAAKFLSDEGIKEI